MKIRVKYEINERASLTCEAGDYLDVASIDDLHMLLIEDAEEQVSWRASLNKGDLQGFWDQILALKQAGGDAS